MRMEATRRNTLRDRGKVGISRLDELMCCTVFLHAAAGSAAKRWLALSADG
jgi:hypothetical protein